MGLYLTCVALAAVLGLATWVGFFGLSLDAATLRLGLVLGVVCAAERVFPVGFGVGRARFEFGGAPILFGLVLGGPACALLAAAPSAVYRDPSRSVFQGSVHVVQVLAASLVFSFFSPAPLSTMSATYSASGDGTWASLAMGVLAAGLVFFGFDALVGPMLMRLKYGLSWREVVEEIVVPALPSDAVAIATVLAASLATVLHGLPVTVVFLAGTFLSVFAANRAREHRKRTLRLEHENTALKEALRDSNLDLVTKLVERQGARDGQAAAHAAASAVYARDVAREMGLGEERAREVHLAALLMDVGLLWVPDEVLLTPPAKLNSLGRMRLEEHPVTGEGVLSSVTGLEQVARWVRWHHEREDGTGYPDRLRSRWIPTEAKILAVCSLYTSLVLDGPHKPGISSCEARRTLVHEIGRTADEEVAKAFLRVLDSEGVSYASASDGRFSFRASGSVSATPR